MATATSARLRKRQSARKIAQQKLRRQKLMMRAGSATAVVLVLVAAGFWWMSARDDDPGSAAIDYGDLPVNGMTIGNLDAPYTVIEYGDYLCIHCAEFMESAQGQFLADFVATGQVKFEFRPMPVLGGDVTSPGNPSVLAAEASLAALDQGMYWEFHDRAFGPTLDGSPQNLTRDYLVGIAEDLGMDVEKFSAALDAGTYRQQVLDYYNEGVALGMSGVPGFFVNGQMVAWPATGYEGFKANLEEVIGA